MGAEKEGLICYFCILMCFNYQWKGGSGVEHKA